MCELVDQDNELLRRREALDDLDASTCGRAKGAAEVVDVVKRDTVRSDRRAQSGR